MELIPSLDDAQKNFAVYLMEKNGIRKSRFVGEEEDGVDEERKDKVAGEMFGLLGRGSRRA